ncbi:MAG: hypothetical protein QGE95_16885, partial [Arenicellales bacterium]|nr:hypothetical protein [Arenicellales bacterium]
NEGYGDFMWNVTDAPEWVTVVPDSSGAGQIEGQAFSLFGKSSSFAQRTSSLSIKPTTHKIPTSKSDIPRDFISTNSRVSVS